MLAKDCSFTKSVANTECEPAPHFYIVTDPPGLKTTKTALLQLLLVTRMTI